MGIARVGHSTVVAGQDQNHAEMSSVDWGIDQQGPRTDIGMAVAELEPGISVYSLVNSFQPH